jgi:hypothetical protein
MNSLAILLMATAAAGADPQPVVQGTVTPYGSYTEAAPESRPSLFGRIRNALSSKSSTASSGPVYPTYQPATSVAPITLAPSVISTQTAVPSARSFAPGGSSAEPPLADAVTTTAPATRVEVRPATPTTVVTQPTYTYSYPAPVTTPAPESNHPRLFPRIRKLFSGSSSKSSPALPEDVIVTPQVGTPVAPALSR